MELPLQFPDPRIEMRQRVLEHQRLPPEERLRALFDTIETGMILIRESPHREVIDRLFLEREAELKRIYRKLFRQHGF